ncbi:MAG: SufS family cysteine desulfurase [Actinobacteria bacterium]|jgi:cysteine desulfurase/selenocysteine lyase|uniref:cysteine desulfurase n=1 Tax=freshwater metagenome TaxID=449393 RepID=A0A6J6X3F4_9ZZZZ|nr:SufS family cysteine desulfurase [Actinomycetota bacterium]
MTFDVATIRKDFPVLHRLVNDKPLVYLDSANTSQKPQVVIDALSNFMETGYAPINRSAYQLAAEATDAFEATRSALAAFINAPKANEVVFTKNATEALNLVIMSWGRANLKAGDTVLLTHMEHHANIVPWHMLVAERGIQLRWVPLTSDGQLDLTNLDGLLKDVKAFSFTSMSNVLGTINPVQRLCAAAHKAGAIAIVDACQSVPHQPTDVQNLGADFMVFSSHKMCGPSGVGVLWGRESLLEAMPPFLGGGNMIADVRLDGFTTAEVPAKFEAGTPAIAEVVALHSAVEFLTKVGMNNIRQHEIELSTYVLNTLTSRFGDDITIHGPTNPELRGATFSFAFRGIHPHDLSQVLDQTNVCVRAGHHCAKPLMKILGANATVRASFYLYNTTQEVDALADALDSASDIF